MSQKGLVMEVSQVIKAPLDSVWESLMDPKKSAEVFFGIAFESDLKKGSPIVWRGEWEGKAFEDGGIILDIEPSRLFCYDYYSNFSGQPNTPEFHQTISYQFEPVETGIRLTITQENIENQEKKLHSEQNWQKMLAMIKTKLEK